MNPNSPLFFKEDKEKHRHKNMAENQVHISQLIKYVKLCQKTNVTVHVKQNFLNGFEQ